MPFCMYILRLRSGKFYVGSTSSLDQRLREHERGLGGRTTNLDPPVGLVYSESYPSLVTARRREAQLKRWSHAKKEALVRADISELKALSKRKRK